MHAEATISPLGEHDVEWASDVQLAATMNRRHLVATTPHCRTGATAARPTGSHEQILVIRDRAGRRRALLLLRTRPGPSTDMFLDVLAPDPRDRGVAFTALRMLTAQAMESPHAHRLVIELAAGDLDWAHALLGPCFVERARLFDAVWVDGTWQDLTVQVCDVASWARFTDAVVDDDAHERRGRNSIRP